jgi:hypothetical protein
MGKASLRIHTRSMENCRSTRKAISSHKKVISDHKKAISNHKKAISNLYCVRCTTPQVSWF